MFWSSTERERLESLMNMVLSTWLSKSISTDSEYGWITHFLLECCIGKIWYPWSFPWKVLVPETDTAPLSNQTWCYLGSTSFNISLQFEFHQIQLWFHEGINDSITPTSLSVLIHLILIFFFITIWKVQACEYWYHLFIRSSLRVTFKPFYIPQQSFDQFLRVWLDLNEINFLAKHISQPTG